MWRKFIINYLFEWFGLRNDVGSFILGIADSVCQQLLEVTHLKKIGYALIFAIGYLAQAYIAAIILVILLFTYRASIGQK